MPSVDCSGWRALYEEGLNDRQIAERIGVDRTTISRRRQTEGLPAHGRIYELDSFPERHALWEQGLWDAEIARRVGVDRGTIGRWRELRGLEANPAPDEAYGAKAFGEYPKRLEMWESGATDREIADAIGLTPGAVLYWRRARGLDRNEREDVHGVGPSSDTAKAWLAGIIDADGHIGVHRGGHGHLYVLLSVSMIHRRTILTIADLCDCGTVSEIEPRRANRRKQWRWQAVARPALTIIRQCMPYMVTKRDRAELADGFGHSMTEDQAKRLQALNY